MTIIIPAENDYDGNVDTLLEDIDWGTAATFDHGWDLYLAL